MRKCANSPAPATSTIKIARPAKALAMELLNNLFLRDFRRGFFFAVGFRFAIYIKSQ
jgi:hypothetical protein